MIRTSVFLALMWLLLFSSCASTEVLHDLDECKPRGELDGHKIGKCPEIRVKK